MCLRFQASIRNRIEPFLFLSTLGPGFRKICFLAAKMLDPCGWNSQDMRFHQKIVYVWTRPESAFDELEGRECSFTGHVGQGKGHQELISRPKEMIRNPRAC